MNDIESLLAPIKELHETIREHVVEASEKSSVEQLSTIVADDEGDTIFAVDRISEDLLIDFFEREIASKVPIVLDCRRIGKRPSSCCLVAQVSRTQSGV